jgi:hypothetical protein
MNQNLYKLELSNGWVFYTIADNFGDAARKFEEKYPFPHPT